MTDDRRDSVAQTLEVLNGPQGILSSKSARSTVSMYGDSPDRLRVWRQVMDRYLDDVPPGAEGGRIEVVTAGAPGSGKSTMVGDVSGFRRIDPDIVKGYLLEREASVGTYEQYLRLPLPDGQPVMLNELAGLVHVESTLIADRLRLECMRRGENVVIEGTLSWAPMIDHLVDEIAIHGYEALRIVNVDVDLATALERCLTRWWSARVDEDQPDGGRYVPKSAVEFCYASTGSSVCTENARELERRARRLMPDLDVTTSTEPESGALRVVEGDR